MNKPAAIEGLYVDAKFMRGYKVTRLSIDIPLEYSEEFFRMFGTPNGPDPVRVVLARMATPPAEPLSSAPQGAPEGPTPEKRERKRSEIAALKCKDQSFQNWLCMDVKPQFGRVWTDPSMTFEEMTDSVLKEHLGIQSKKELDTDPFKAAEWDKLITSFEVRAYARAGR